MKWYKDTFDNESSEFDRVTTEITPKTRDKNAKVVYDTRWNSTFAYLERLYKKTKPVTLKNSIWSVLENTDSWRTETLDAVNKAIKQNSKGSGSRDIQAVLNELTSAKIRCPIILKKDNRYTLIAGNTRLMGCRLLKMNPQVVILEMKLN